MMELNNSRPKNDHERLLTSATEPLWTVEDVAEYLRVRPETVRVMARAQKIPALKLGKVWRFRASEIIEMLDRR